MNDIFNSPALRALRRTFRPGTLLTRGHSSLQPFPLPLPGGDVEPKVIFGAGPALRDFEGTAPETNIVELPVADRLNARVQAQQSQASGPLEGPTREVFSLTDMADGAGSPLEFDESTSIQKDRVSHGRRDLRKTQMEQLERYREDLERIRSAKHADLPGLRRKLRDRLLEDEARGSTFSSVRAKVIQEMEEASKPDLGRFSDDALDQEIERLERGPDFQGVLKGAAKATEGLSPIGSILGKLDDGIGFLTNRRIRELKAERERRRGRSGRVHQE